MKRRDFLGAASGAALNPPGLVTTGLALLGIHAPGWAQGVGQRANSLAERILILIELKGGNDGLNTVVPYADPAYYVLRNSIGIKPDEVIKIDARVGLHPELRAVLPLWEKGELGIVQGVGYPSPNLSHFRSIEIWETSSNANEYLDDGWVSRAMKAGYAKQANFTAEGVLIGTSDLGPLAGARAVTLNNPEAFVSQARFAGQTPALAGSNAALHHLLKVEGYISVAAQGLRGDKFNFTTEFPQGQFGNGVRAAAQVVASQNGKVNDNDKDKDKGKGCVPVIMLTLGSFDTHQNQLVSHGALLRQLGEGMAALKSALTELAAWDRTLVMTFSEFGRRARQNSSGGTDHGTAAPHFIAGGAVRGGLYGQAPDLARLDAAQNLVHTTDFRQLYATVAKDWWGVSPQAVVRGKFDAVKFLRS